MHLAVRANKVRAASPPPHPENPRWWSGGCPLKVSVPCAMQSGREHDVICHDPETLSNEICASHSAQLISSSRTRARSKGKMVTWRNTGHRLNASIQNPSGIIIAVNETACQQVFCIPCLCVFFFRLSKESLPKLFIQMRCYPRTSVNVQ